MIELAKQMRDALEVYDSAVAVLGEPTLKLTARELVEAVRRNTSIDSTMRESVRAKIAQKATQTVLEQAEILCAEWAA